MPDKHLNAPALSAARQEPEGEKSWTVYMLRCGDGTLYTGATCDLPRRLAAHQRGRGAKYPRCRLPVVLVYREAAENQSAALRREAAIKRLRRTEKLALIGAASSGDSHPAQGLQLPP